MPLTTKMQRAAQYMVKELYNAAACGARQSFERRLDEIACAPMDEIAEEWNTEVDRLLWSAVQDEVNAKRTTVIPFLLEALEHDQ